MELTEEQEGLIQWGESLEPEPEYNDLWARRIFRQARTLAAAARELADAPSLHSGEERKLGNILVQLGSVQRQWNDPEGLSHHPTASRKGGEASKG